MRCRSLHLVILIVMTTAAIYAKAGSNTTLRDAPPKFRAVENPFSNNESARLAGQKLFTRHCSECHGKTAEGTAQAPALQDISNEGTPGMLYWFIKNGNLRTGMPSWARLPDQQLWQVITYLQTLGN
jgi:mono/diheme cytochrome c family protein